MVGIISSGEQIWLLFLRGHQMGGFGVDWFGTCFLEKKSHGNQLTAERAPRESSLTTRGTQLFKKHGSGYQLATKY